MSLIGVASYRQSFTVLQPVTENFKIVFLQVQKFTLNPVLISVEGGTVRVVGEHNEKDQVISFFRYSGKMVGGWVLCRLLLGNE